MHACKQVNLKHPDGVNALMYGAAGAHTAVVEVCVHAVLSLIL
jgi:hypothetical protein